MILKEMHYQRKDICETLANGTYKGHEYIVRNYGSHPCCYVSIPEGQAINEDSIVCHGGITYTGESLPQEECINGVWWIGWDYAHLGDYLCLSDRKPSELEKCWTSEELENDCIKVIDQLETTEDAEEK